MSEAAVYQLLNAHKPSGSTVVPYTDNVTTGLPKIVYTATGSPRGYNDSGPDGIVAGRYQLDIFAATLLAGHAVAEQIVAALDGYKGTTAGTQFLRVHFPETPRTERPTNETGAAIGVARVTLEMIATHRS